MAGNLVPETPAIERLETLPRRRRSKSTRATTPIFLSEVDWAPPTKPVVYSPVPTIRTDGGAIVDVGLRYFAANGAEVVFDGEPTLTQQRLAEELLPQQEEITALVSLLFFEVNMCAAKQTMPISKGSGRQTR